MTPDEARDLLDGTTPGPWEWCEGKDQNGEFVALSGTDGATYVAQEAQKNPSDLDLYADDLPAVVIATGDEYRAAMQALREVK